MSKDKYYKSGKCDKCGKEYDKYYCEWDDFSLTPEEETLVCPTCGHKEKEEDSGELRYRKRI